MNASTSNDQNTDVIIEWAPFTLKDGIEEQALLEAANAIQAHFLLKQKGYIKRELLKGKDRQWVDIVHWQSLADAEQAASDVLQSPICIEYFTMMTGIDLEDPAGSISHYQQKLIWSGDLV